jgi:fibronectin type 3 domain-containing protein
VNCAGTATGRLTNFTTATLIAPDPPMPFPGPRQYEAECFDYKNVAGITKGGYSGSIRNYTGQGYLQFGTSSSAAVRDSVSVLNAGTYRLQTRYAVTGLNINTIHLYVNGVYVAAPLFTQTGPLGEWATNEQNVTLNAGTNTIEFRANAAAASSIYFDNIVVVPTAYGGGLVIQENQPGFAGLDGAINTNQPGYTGAGFADTYDASGAGVYWSLNFDSSVPKSFTFRYACTDDRTADLIVDGTNVASNIRFLSTGSWTNWDYVTIYATVPAGESLAQLRSTTGSGLPDLDSMEITGGTAWAWLAGTVPFEPLGLSATPVSTSQINLAWSAAQGADRYNVKRATASGGPYTTIASNVSAAAYSDTGLSTLTTYYYVVSAVNTSGESANSAEAGATTHTTQPPAAPTGLSAAGVSFNQINLTWTAAPGANTYAVKRSLSSGGPYITVAVGVTETSFTDTGLFAVTPYYYVVAAVNGMGEGANSAEASTSTLSTANVEPVADTYVRDGGSTNTNFGFDTTLPVKNDGTNGFTRNSFLKFDMRGLADAQSIQLQLTPYQVDGSATLACELVTDDSWTETGMTWNNQPAGSGMVITNVSGYVVGQQKNIPVTGAATNEAAGDGIFSLKISQPSPVGIFVGFNSRETANSALRPVLGCTFSHIAYPPPGTPTGLAARAISSNQIDLTWPASTGASQYNVKRASASGGPYTLIAAARSETTFSDHGLSEGAAYFYVVSAINGTGESADSTEAYAIPGTEYQENGGILSMEAEHGTLGSRWLTGVNAGASGGAFIEIDPVYNNTGSAPAGTTAEYLAAYDFHISTNGNHRFWFRMYSDNANDDSFFWRIDSGSWIQENGRFGIGSWYSTDNTQVDNLSAGDHVLQVSYRENGARLDKFVIQLDGLTAPSGVGPAESSRSFGGPPTVPTGLGATAVSASQINVSWTASLGATSYNVKRSTTSGAPYETVVSNVLSTSYSDTAGLSAGTRYYYVVSALNAGVESGNSAETSAVPSALISPNEYQIASCVVAGTNLSLTTSNSVPGHDYTVWVTDSLTAPNWQPLGVAQAGTGSALNFTVPVDGRASRFFKLDVQRQ